MSGRPKKPYQYAVSIVNYPAGSDPWSGLPIAVQPVADYLTPSDDIAAEDYNYALQQATGAPSRMLDYLGQVPANNWPTKTMHPSGTSTDTVKACAWDPFRSRWVFVTSNTASVCSTYDGETFFNEVTPGISPSASIAVRPSDGTLLICAPDGNTAHLTGSCATVNALGTAWTTHSSAPSGAGKALVWFVAAGLFVSISSVNSGAFPAIVATSPDGATWTDRTTGAAFVNGWGGAGAPTLGWYAQSATTLLAFSPVANYATYYSTQDGATWTSHTSPVTTGESILAASYDDENALYVLLTNDGTNSRCLTSSDGVAWTSNAMPVPNDLQANTVFSGIAAMGSLYVATAKGSNGSAYAPAYYSVNKGVTWVRCRGYLMGQPLATVTADRVFSGGGQFVTYNSTNVNFSFIVG